MKAKASHGQNVISMFGYKCETLFPAINEVEAYWEGLRMGRLVPMRSEIDPRGIERALEYTFILERIAPGLARFRLSGVHLNDLLGMEVRGMPFTSFFTPKARQLICDTLEDVFDGPQIAEFTLSGERSIGKPALDAKVILLPLRSDMGDVTRIIGCLVSSGPIGRAPRRFDIVKRKMKVLTAGQAPMVDPNPIQSPIMEPAGFMEPVGFAEPAGFAEPKAPFVTAGDSAKKRPDDKRPALRLVKSDD